MTRKYLEDITGIVTGSNMDNRFSRNFALTHCGFKGEVHYGDSVWVFKSHVPNVQANFTRQFISKAVVCVRNPFDVACSAIQLRLTYTHSLSARNNVATEFPALWNEYLVQTTRLYNNTLEYWTQAAARRAVPVHFFRYEDMLSDPLGVLKGLLAFMLGVESVEGTFVWHRAQQVVAQDQRTRSIYTPRSGGVIKNMSQFSPEQVDFVLKQSARFIRFFNYTGLLKPLTDE